jgi:hypothetical protein
LPDALGVFGGHKVKAKEGFSLQATRGPKGRPSGIKWLIFFILPEKGD